MSLLPELIEWNVRPYLEAAWSENFSNKCVLNAEIERQDGTRLQYFGFWWYSGIPNEINEQIFTLLLPDGGSAAAKCATRTSSAAASAKIRWNEQLFASFCFCPKECQNTLVHELGAPARHAISKATEWHKKHWNDTSNDQKHQTLKQLCGLASAREPWSTSALNGDAGCQVSWSKTLPGNYCTKCISQKSKKNKNDIFPTKSWRSSV